jgi:diguanylate cyclase (GGDEF)-like protein
MQEKIAFEHSVFKNNLIKILVIGGIYTLFEVVGLVMSTLGFFESDIRLYVAIIVAFHILYLTYLFAYKKKLISLSKTKRIHVDKIYYVVILIWGSVFTVLVYLEVQDITIYAIVCLMIAAMFIVEPKAILGMFAGNMIVFSVLVYLMAESVLIANGIVFKGLIVTVIAYLISRSNYKIRFNNYEMNRHLAVANEKLQDQAVRDSLTRLYNNGFIFDYLENAIEKVRKKTGALTILMIDIDDFKQVNDTHGHLVGDDVIRAISQLLIQETRDQDVVARYGGEEFMVVLNDTTKEQGGVIAERIRKKVEENVHAEIEKVTVSIGMAQLSDESLNELIQRADKKLYEAKAGGKNVVC